MVATLLTSPRGSWFEHGTVVCNMTCFFAGNGGKEGRKTSSPCLLCHTPHRPLSSLHLPCSLPPSHAFLPSLHSLARLASCPDSHDSDRFWAVGRETRWLSGRKRRNWTSTAYRFSAPSPAATVTASIKRLYQLSLNCRHGVNLTGRSQHRLVERRIVDTVTVVGSPLRDSLPTWPAYTLTASTRRRLLNVLLQHDLRAAFAWTAMYYRAAAQPACQAFTGRRATCHYYRAVPPHARTISSPFITFLVPDSFDHLHLRTL